MNFNGKNSFMTVSNSILLNMSEFTILFWFKVVGNNFLARLIGKGTNLTQSFGVYFKNQGDIFSLYYGFNDSMKEFSSNNLNFTQWHSIVYDFSPSYTAFYYDGGTISIGFTNRRYLQNNSDRLVLGIDPGTNGYSKAFNGSIDNVIIFNKFLPINDISALIQLSKSGKINFSTLFTTTTSSQDISSTTNINSFSISPPTTFSLFNNFFHIIIMDTSYVVIFGLIVISVIIAFSYVNYRRNYKNNNKINKKQSFKEFLIEHLRKNRQKRPKEHLSNETLDLIENIIEENKL